MASIFPMTYRNSNTIPADPTETQLLETGDLFNHPLNGLQYVYTEPSPGQPSTDYWRVVKAIIANDYVLRSGDTMTGDLTLPTDPTADLHASTKQYVDGVQAQIIPFIIALG